MEPLLLTDTTSNKSAGKTIFASALFIAMPSEFNTTDNVNMLPGARVVELELICIVAAFALLNPKKNTLKNNTVA